MIVNIPGFHTRPDEPVNQVSDATSFQSVNVTRISKPASSRKIANATRKRISNYRNRTDNRMSGISRPFSRLNPSALPYTTPPPHLAPLTTTTKPKEIYNDYRRAHSTYPPSYYSQYPSQKPSYYPPHYQVPYTPVYQPPYFPPTPMQHFVEPQLRDGEAHIFPKEINTVTASTPAFPKFYGNEAQTYSNEKYTPATQYTTIPQLRDNEARTYPRELFITTTQPTTTSQTRYSEPVQPLTKTTTQPSTVPKHRDNEPRTYARQPFTTTTSESVTGTSVKDETRPEDNLFRTTPPITTLKYPGITPEYPQGYNLKPYHYPSSTSAPPDHYVSRDNNMSLDDNVARVRLTPSPPARKKAGEPSQLKPLVYKQSEIDNDDEEPNDEEDPYHLDKIVIEPDAPAPYVPFDLEGINGETSNGKKSLPQWLLNLLQKYEDSTKITKSPNKTLETFSGLNGKNEKLEGSEEIKIFSNSSSEQSLETSSSEKSLESDMPDAAKTSAEGDESPLVRMGSPSTRKLMKYASPNKQAK